ncbi:hypothetical protein [Micromonospora thermarum]|uniref:hypothetical protein n=1 Tax=Micromonospora thermarum TaxID=2720024 RepID=UPI0028163BAC|nr:hypothetical protein [Micromonospora thermarum]
MSARRLVAVLTAVVLLAGCERATSFDGPEPPLRPAWASLSLPLPPGPPGRLLLRDAATCGGRWYVTGGVADAAGGTRPAAWTSADGVTFTPLTLVPSSFSGEQHVLSAVACRGSRVAAVGSKGGGVHGNPRVGTWAQGPDGALREVLAPFEQFGGPRAVRVGRLVAGPRGWLVVGSRVAGAAVWISPDSSAFTLVEGAPELAGDGRGRTAADDAVAVPSGWLVVGSLLAAAGPRPLAWTSADGRVWRRAELPGGPVGSGAAQRVVASARGPVAVGSAGAAGFGAWRLSGDGWRWVGTLGTAGTSAGGGVPSVAGLAAAGGDLVAVVREAAGHALWTSSDAGDSWRPMALPRAVPDTGDTAVAVATDGDRLLLVEDDGKGSRAWWGRVPAVDR